MKRMIRILDYSPERINGLEMAINQYPFSYLRNRETKRFNNPFDAVILYENGETPWLG